MTALKIEPLSAEKTATFDAPSGQAEWIAQLRAVIRALAGNIRALEDAIEPEIPFGPGDMIDALTLRGASQAEDEVATIGFEKAVADMAAANTASAQVLGMHPCDDAHWPTAAQVEREHIVRTLQHAADNQSVAARLLDIDRHQLRRRMQEYGLMQPGQARRGRPVSSGVMPCKKAA